MCWLLGLTVCLILIPVDVNTQEAHAYTCVHTHPHTLSLRFSQDLVLIPDILQCESWNRECIGKETHWVPGR